MLQPVTATTITTQNNNDLIKPKILAAINLVGFIFGILSCVLAYTMKDDVSITLFKVCAGNLCMTTDAQKGCQQQGSVESVAKALAIFVCFSFGFIVITSIFSFVQPPSCYDTKSGFNFHIMRPQSKEFCNCDSSWVAFSGDEDHMTQEERNARTNFEIPSAMKWCRYIPLFILRFVIFDTIILTGLLVALWIAPFCDVSLQRDVKFGFGPAIVMPGLACCTAFISRYYEITLEEPKFEGDGSVSREAAQVVLVGFQQPQYQHHQHQQPPFTFVQPTPVVGVPVQSAQPQLIVGGGGGYYYGQQQQQQQQVAYPPPPQGFVGFANVHQ
jgi:hypothetical protein